MFRADCPHYRGKPFRENEIMATTTEPTPERDKQYEILRAVGAGAYSSIVEMVAALECDYDRLEELRDELDGWEPENGKEFLAGWAANNPDEAEELKELEEEAGECKDQDEARQRIQEDALSVRIFGERTDGEWVADKFEILLATGGPAVRIMGELDANGEPSHAWLEIQDWGTPWQEYYETGIRDTLLAYCRCFYFGE